MMETFFLILSRIKMTFGEVNEIDDKNCVVKKVISFSR